MKTPDTGKWDGHSKDSSPEPKMWPLPQPHYLSLRKAACGSFLGDPQPQV